MQIKTGESGGTGGFCKRNARRKRLRHRRMKPDGEDLTVDCKDSLVIEEGPSEFRPEKKIKGVDGDFDGSLGSSSSPGFSEKSSEFRVEEENIIREEDLGTGGSQKMFRSSFGSISVMGRRRVMEDALTVSPGILAAEEFEFFAAYESHGAVAAHACRDRLHQIIEEELNERKRVEEDPTTSTVVDAAAPSGGETKSKTNGIAYWRSIMEASFSKMDEEVQAQMNQSDGAEAGKVGVEEVGWTAAVVMVGMEELLAAYCGDSRVVLCRGGVAFSISNDHKLNSPGEKDRVEAAGGRIIDGLVQGVRITSRSIGDHNLKPYVISKPEVTVNRRTEVDEFLIIATDGLWDVLSNDTACEVVRRCLNGQINRNFIGESNAPAEAAAAILAQLAIAKGTRDNISVIVVDLKNGGSKSSHG